MLFRSDRPIVVVYRPHHLRGAAVRTAQGGGDSAGPEHDHPIGRVREFFRVRRDEQDSRTPLCRLTDQFVDLGPGEVVGLAGLLGSGRSSLLRAVFGTLPIRAGSILIDGREVAFRHSGDAVRAGVAYVLENRMGDACFPDLPVHSNISMAAIRRYWSGWRLNHRRERSTARDLMAAFRVKAPSERVDRKRHV